MAPTERKTTNKNFSAQRGNKRNPKSREKGVKKRKWVPEHKTFQGGVKEGQGFAFKRKEKVRHEYNKLLRKEEKIKRKKNAEIQPQYRDEYPEHLKHLYLAEAQKLKQEAWTHRVNRSKVRGRGHKQEEEPEENDAAADADAPQTEAAADADAPETEAAETADQTTASEKESLPVSNRMRKKMERKTSYQKTKEEYEQMKEKQRKKKEEFLKNKQQREEAVRKYKQKKMETFQMLSKKTKKGQPNLNLQMEYLLQKIQGNQK